jgi:hypothetical protein
MEDPSWQPTFVPYQFIFKENPPAAARQTKKILRAVEQLVDCHCSHNSFTSRRAALADTVIGFIVATFA